MNLHSPEIRSQNSEKPAPAFGKGKGLYICAIWAALVSNMAALLMSTDTIELSH